jgi:chromosomal replication initiation ATPase DnaA
MILPQTYVRAAMIIARDHGYTLEQVTARSRNRNLVAARKAVALHVRGMGASYPELGALLKRDHTTIMQTLRGRRG